MVGHSTWCRRQQNWVLLGWCVIVDAVVPKKNRGRASVPHMHPLVMRSKLRRTCYGLVCVCQSSCTASCSCRRVFGGSSVQRACVVSHAALTVLSQVCVPTLALCVRPAMVCRQLAGCWCWSWCVAPADHSTILLRPSAANVVCAHVVTSSTSTATY